MTTKQLPRARSGVAGLRTERGGSLMVLVSEGNDQSTIPPTLAHVSHLETNKLQISKEEARRTRTGVARLREGPRRGRRTLAAGCPAALSAGRSVTSPGRAARVAHPHRP